MTEIDFKIAWNCMNLLLQSLRKPLVKFQTGI